MGLFSFGKKRAADGFEFAIDNTYALQTGDSAVVTGRLKHGRITPGTMAICLDADGEPLFSCPVEGIEQGTHIMKVAVSDARGTYGAHYGLKLGGVIKSQIPTDGTLVNETSERTQALQERIAREGVPGQAKKTQDGPVGSEREDELLPLLLEERIPAEHLKPLKIQECIFLLCSLQSMNSQEPVEHYAEKGNLLFSTIIDKLNDAPSLYITLDETTGLPFITGDTVDVYSAKKLAQQAASFYGSQNRHLLVREVSKEDSGLPGHIGLFAWLYYLGMERILVDNGAYKIVLNRADLLPPPDEDQLKRMEVPVTNPSLRFAMADFLGEVRWRVSYKERQDNIKAKEGRLMEELCRARLLIPVKGEALKQGIRILPQDTSLNIPRVEDNEGRAFLPLFTDWLDFQRAYSKEEWGAMVIPVMDGIAIAGEDGIVINPLGENLILNAAAIDKIKKAKSSSKNA